MPNPSKMWAKTQSAMLPPPSYFPESQIIRLESDVDAMVERQHVCVDVKIQNLIR